MDSKRFFLLYFLCLGLISSVYSQYVLYQVCDSCRTTSGNDLANHLFNYGASIPFEPKDVEGDYDMRWYQGVSNVWHRGIDYSSIDNGRGDIDRGDALLAIEGGTITQIDGEGYKYIVIEGENGHHFGYGHIFPNQNPGNSHLISGNFVLKRYLRNNVNLYAIINLADSTAIASTSGDTLVYPNSICQDTFVTTNIIARDQTIAPMGGSSGYPVHLHLYRFRNPRLGGNLVQRATNCMDPWTFIEHPTLTNLNGYDLELHTFGETNDELAVNYPAISYQTMRVRAKMSQAAAPIYHVGNNQYSDNSRYSSTLMDINEITVLIKNSNETHFKLFEGARYKSKINLGGNDSIVSNFYPNVDLVTSTFGSWSNVTGMGGRSSTI